MVKTVVQSASESITGVVKIPGWSLKAWWSVTRHAWLVQVEHDIPERGGWIRAWLCTDTGMLAEFDLLSTAFSAIDRFVADPDWTQCREYLGGV